jgi:hypothetical protein
MSARQKGLEGWKFRAPFDSVSDGVEKPEEKVTKTVVKNRKLRSKKGTTESKEERKRKRVQSKATMIQKAGKHRF